MKKNTTSTYGTIQGALSLIHSGDVIATSIYGNEPRYFMENLHTIAPRVENVLLWTMITMRRYPVMQDASLRGKIDIVTFFYNEDCRKHYESGRIEYLPLNLHAVGADIVAAHRPTVYVVAVTPPDENGNVCISFDMQASLECLEAAQRVIFEINPQLKRTCGDTAVPLAAADYVYEADYPLPTYPEGKNSLESQKIAGFVAELIHDGDCIQLGIGEIPNEVGHALRHKRDLGIHSEMFTATMGDLMRRGVITNSAKTLNRGKAICAFAWGDQALYDLMADNRAIEVRRASYVNDPFIIAQNDNMVSINTALQIDLTGQICSESIGSRQYSGTGGATDFAYGAYHAKNGRGIIAVSSTAKGGSVSRICAQLTPGAVVSISRNIVDHVVTEYGVAKLRGKTVAQRVEELISVSHPDFRDQLRWEAQKLFLR